MAELTSFAVLVALTTGLTEVFKRVGLPKRIIPLFALAVGFALSLIGNLTNITPLTILSGIAIGLSSMGLFDITKVVKK